MFQRIRGIGLVLSFALSVMTGFADTRLIFPRIVFQNGLYSGIAISNPTGSTATITLTAYKSDGTKLGDPVSASLPSGGQYLNVAWQVFDPTQVLQGSNTPIYCWVEVTSTTTGLAGFYIEFNDALTFQSGGDLGTFGTDLYLPAVDNSATSVTEISLVNGDTSTNGGAANVTVDFLKADGTNVASKNLVINQAASLQGSLATLSAFSGVAFDQVASLRVRSDRPVLCYGIVKPQSGKTPVALPAEDVNTPAQTLYFPQLADGQLGGAVWNTSIGISNLNFSAQTLVNITAFDKNGNVFVDPTITNPKSVTIPAGGFLRSTFKDLFPFTDTSYKEGWLKVDANSPSINGFVEYGAGNNRALVIAQLNPFQLSMFSHQAQGAASGGHSYFTGLAVLNSGSLAANVEIFSLGKDGSTVGRIQTILKPGQRTSQLLYQLVSESAGANSGCVFVRSDRPVFTTELFAKDDVSALANVPPQQVTASFNPQSNLPRITPVPQLAVVETGKTRTFTAPGIGGTIQWFVNGTKGDATIGTITDAGVYTAPAKAPAPKTLTIQASIVGGNNSGASSMDVVQREQLTGGLTLVTAVAYITNLQRFFVAEQQLLSGSPSIGFAATPANTQISEVVQSGSGTTNSAFVKVSGDTISKMLPYDTDTNHYMLLAGQDLGKIYRLDVSSKDLKTVVSGLSQPTSMALDPTTGNLLVAEAGAGQITVITPAQIAAASDPTVGLNSPSAGPRLQVISVPNIQGITVDKCSGTVYVTLSDNTIWQYQGSSRTQIDQADTFIQPTQLLALYRDGLSCAAGLTLAVVESGRVSLVYPKAAIPRTTLVDNLTGVRDIVYFPKGNPFTTGSEATIGVAEASSTAAQGKVENLSVGGCYQSTPPVTFATIRGGTGPNDDPIGDTFDPAGSVASQFGYTIPDMISVTGSAQGGQSVITIKFTAPVTLGSLPTGTGLPPDGVWAYILMKTTAGSQALTQLPITFSEYFPFGDASTYTFDSILYVFGGQGYFVSLTGQASLVRVSAIGNTLILSVPTTALNLSGALGIVLVGNPAEITDVAPNNGLLNLTP